jgi:hypothetical protein
MPLPDASHSITNIFEKSRSARTGGRVIAILSSLQVDSDVGVHQKAPFLSMSVRGLAIYL